MGNSTAKSGGAVDSEQSWNKSESPKRSSLVVVVDVVVVVVVVVVKFCLGRLWVWQVSLTVAKERFAHAGSRRVAPDGGRIDRI